MSLGSAPIPRPAQDEHVRGPSDAPLVIEYADFACHHCAITYLRLRERRLRVLFRHFPVTARHLRARACAQAAEAAALQGAFWPMHDALFADQGRLDDPHLWRRARELGLDVERFDADRRSEAVSERVARDFHSGVRGGVVSTPTLVVDGELHAGPPPVSLLVELEARGSTG